MSSAKKYIPYYTYEDWLYWDGQWELIEGVPVAMSPKPLPEHQRVTAALMLELGLAVRKSGCKHCKVYDSIDYKIAEDTIFEPDVLIVCNGIVKPYLDFLPALLIEVLSKGTEERDRGIKYDYYERQGVNYYLIVDTKKKVIEVYQLKNGRYQLHEYRDNFEFNLHADCSITPALNNIWE